MAEEDNTPDHVEVVTPVVVDMGKRPAKRLKALRKGKGPMMSEVLSVLEEVAEQMGDEAADKTFVPIVMVVEEKPKKKRRKIVFPF